MYRTFFQNLFIDYFNVDKELAMSIIDFNNENFIIEKIIEENGVSLEVFLNYLEDLFDIGYVDKINTDFNFSDLLDNKILLDNLACPISLEDNTLHIATPNIFFNNIFDAYGDKYNIKLYYATNKTLAPYFNEYLDKSAYHPTIDDDINSLNNILKRAIVENASDIHLEPYDDKIICRIRVDGQLKLIGNLDFNTYNTILSQIKYISKIDITKKMRPHDGHFERVLYRNTYDFRVSTLPTIYGEKCVLRIIYKFDNLLSYKNLGFSEKDLINIKNILNTTQGLILVTGPTGSGKTTTLSSFVNYINHSNINIITIEDPVENIIDGITQVSLNSKAGVTFDSVLPYLLRQDPDVMMIGEIRNSETARLAMTASVTGHLVLSTLHTNNAIATITRLIDMGIKPYLIASSIQAIISQKLVRKVCPHCKDNEESCSYCQNTGYFGRHLVYELLVIDDKIKKIITNNYDEYKLKEYVKEIDFKSINDRGNELIKLGITTENELIKLSND